MVVAVAVILAVLYSQAARHTGPIHWDFARPSLLKRLGVPE